MDNDRPAANAEEGADTIQLRLLFPGSNEKGDVKEMELLFPRWTLLVEKELDEVFGQLIVSLEEIPDRIQ